MDRRYPTRADRPASARRSRRSRGRSLIGISNTKVERIDRFHVHARAEQIQHRLGVDDERAPSCSTTSSPARVRQIHFYRTCRRIRFSTLTRSPVTGDDATLRRPRTRSRRRRSGSARWTQGEAHGSSPDIGASRAIHSIIAQRPGVANSTRLWSGSRSKGSCPARPVHPRLDATPVRPARLPGAEIRRREGQRECSRPMPSCGGISPPADAGLGRGFPNRLVERDRHRRTG